MKRFFAFFLLVLSFKNICAQLQVPFDSSTQKVSYKGIIEMQGVSKAVIFSKSIDWVTGLHVKGTGNSIEIQDLELGKILTKDTFHIMNQYGADVIVYYTLVIEVKEGKSRIKFSDLYSKADIGKSTFIGSNFDGIWSGGTFEDIIIAINGEWKKKKMMREYWTHLLTESDKKVNSYIDGYLSYVERASINKDDW
jgi:hypothetical protein